MFVYGRFGESPLAGLVVCLCVPAMALAEFKFDISTRGEVSEMGIEAIAVTVAEDGARLDTLRGADGGANLLARLIRGMAGAWTDNKDGTQAFVNTKTFNLPGGRRISTVYSHKHRHPPDIRHGCTWP